MPSSKLTKIRSFLTRTSYCVCCLRPSRSIHLRTSYTHSAPCLSSDHLVNVCANASVIFRYRYRVTFLRSKFGLIQLKSCLPPRQSRVPHGKGGSEAHLRKAQSGIVCIVQRVFIAWRPDGWGMFDEGKLSGRADLFVDHLKSTTVHGAAWSGWWECSYSHSGWRKRKRLCWVDFFVSI